MIVAVRDYAILLFDEAFSGTRKFRNLPSAIKCNEIKR